MKLPAVLSAILPPVLVCLAACRTAQNPRQPLPEFPAPEFPAVDLTGSPPAVRAAIETALQAARAKPDDAVAAAKAGLVLHAHERFAAAAVCYQRAQALDPNRFEYPYYRGTALAAAGKYAEALEPLRRSLELDKNSIPARLKLADTLFAAGQSATGQSATGQYKEAQAEYRKVIAQGDNATAWYGLGRTQDTPEAIASFEKALALFPHYGAAQSSLAEAYGKTGQTAKAEALLKAYERDKSTVPPLDDPYMAAVYAQDVSTAAMLRRAEALDQQGRLEEATALEEEALQQDPKLVPAWTHLISLHGRLGHPDQAEAAFRKAIELAPNHPGPYYNLGVLRLAAERYPEAQKAFEKTIQLDPRHANALRNLGTLAEQAGQLDRAAGYLQQTLAVMPEFRAARFQLGRVYVNQHRYADAAAQFRQTLAPADSETPVYRYTLAATLVRLGKREEAISEMRKAREEAMRFGLTDVVHAIEADLAKLGVKA